MSIPFAWLTVGKLVAPQGLRGEIRINPSSDFPERFTVQGDRWLQTKNEDPRKIELTTGRQIPGKALYVVKFKGINDRLAAELLIGQKLLVPASSLPQLESHEFHLLELIGLDAKLDKDDTSIGKVTDLTTAGNDLLEIELRGGKKVFVPFVKAIVPEVNVKKGWLRISPPPGLFDL